MESEILLSAQNISHSFYLSKTASVRALDKLSFEIRRGEIYGLVGESGSGKSTAARCVMNLVKPQSGHIFYQGIDITDPRQFAANKKLLQTSRQMIFQDSTSSLNGRMKVADIIAEPMRIAHIAIARALCMEPELLVADEPVASLDVSIQAQIVNLFRHLQAEHGFSFLFIAHDLSMVRYLCDRVGVLLRGKLVEEAPSHELFQNPQHPYTKALLSAMPLPDPIRERSRKLVTFDADTLRAQGVMREVSPGHFVRTEGGEEA